jgi:hypothetical protein
MGNLKIASCHRLAFLILSYSGSCSDKVLKVMCKFCQRQDMGNKSTALNIMCAQVIKASICKEGVFGFEIRMIILMEV